MNATWTEQMISNARAAMMIGLFAGKPENFEYWADRYDRLCADREMWEDEYERTMARVHRIGGSVVLLRSGPFFGKMHEFMHADDYAAWAEATWVDWAEREDC